MTGIPGDETQTPMGSVGPVGTVSAVSRNARQAGIKEATRSLYISVIGLSLMVGFFSAGLCVAYFEGWTWRVVFSLGLPSIFALIHWLEIKRQIARLAGTGEGD